MMKYRALDKETITEMALIPDTSSPITVPRAEEIIEMLKQGHDSYTITKTLKVSAVAVVNAERKSRNVKRLMREPGPPILEDEQIINPAERLLLFPPPLSESESEK